MAAEDGRTWPEWMKDFLIAGPLGVLTLYETWSPLLEIADHWGEGRYEYAVPLTIFATIQALAVAVIAAVVFRKLRNSCGWWRRRHGRDHPHQVNGPDRV